MKCNLQLTADGGSEFFDGVFQDCLVGRRDLKEAILPFLPRWGWDESVDEFLQVWFREEHHLNSQLIEVIQRLRKQGHFCGIATNQERYRLAYMRCQMRCGELFDRVFGSADVGAVKPSPRFFAGVTSRLTVRPEEIFFWDDSEDNVHAARAFGWHAHHFSSVDGLLPLLQFHSLI